MAALELRPFTVDVDEAVLADLRERLDRTRWPAQVPGVGWEHGADLGVVREVCEHWRHHYDWRAAEAVLNAVPQHLVAVDGVDLHLLRVPGVGPADGPPPPALLLLHGWPGSVWEFVRLLGPLSDPAAHGGDAADAVELVVPSLPGFGFSSAPAERGWGPTRIAHALDALMRGLGHEAYAVHGGDWGGIVGSQLAALHPDSCRLLHTTMPVAPAPADPSPEEAERQRRMREHRARESAYHHVQRTKPDSLTLAQHDSPAGLAAWVLEKFHGWSDLDGGDLLATYDVDDLVTNLMLYWVPGSAPSAARLYLEHARDEQARALPPVTVPTAVAHFPAEPFAASREAAELRYDLRRWTEMEVGGHFAALEQPAALVDDVQAFLRGHRGWLRPADGRLDRHTGAR